MAVSRCGAERFDTAVLIAFRRQAPMTLAPLQTDCGILDFESGDSVVLSRCLEQLTAHEEGPEQRVAVRTAEREVARLERPTVPLLNRAELDACTTPFSGQPPMHQRAYLGVKPIDETLRIGGERVADRVAATRPLLRVVDVGRPLTPPTLHVDE